MREGFAPLLAALAFVGSQANGAPLYGFTPFAYKVAPGVEDEVFAFAAQYGTLTSIPRDGKCIPWSEALVDGAFPAWLEDQWAADAARIPAEEKVLLFLTPTQQDRHTLAEPCGSAEDAEDGSYPAAWQSLEKRFGNLLDRSDVQLAYRNYTKRPRLRRSDDAGEP